MTTTPMNRITRGIKLACLVTTAAGGFAASPALAQDAAADDVEVIAVTGIRASTKENINQKRYSQAIVDAITAEDIGKFPDKNVAESLSRIPGITIDRDFGEGQGVAIRGIQADQNLTLLNGQAVGTSQWFVLSNAARNFNFEILASEMVAGLEVYKSSQADIDEGALGGTVILRTRKPLELDSGTGRASIEMQYNDIAEEADPSFSGLYSWKNKDETFGVLASVSYQERTVSRETNEDFGWFGPSIERIDPLIEAPTGATQKGAIPWGIGSALFEQDRERLGVDLNIQWAPNDKVDMNLHYLNSTLKADNVNSNLIGIPFRGVAFLGTDTNVGTINNGIVESLQVRGVDNRPGWARHIAYDNIFREGSEMSTEVLDFEGNYQFENGKLHWQVGTTTGEGINNDFFTEFWVDATDPRANFDFFNPGGTAPAIDFTTPSPWLQNPGDEMWLGGIFDQQNRLEDKENYAQVDYTYDVEFGVVSQIKTGLKIRDRSYSQTRYRTDLANLAPTGEGSLGPASQFWSGDMVNVSHSNTSGIAQSYFMPDREAMYSAMYAVSECNGGDGLCRNSNVLQQSASFEIEEDITAMYVMANIDGDGLRGNVGLRYVSTDQTSNGFDLVSGNPISLDGEYSAWLPSLNLAFDLTDDIVLRVAGSKVMTRPAPFQLSPAVNLTPETSSGSAGNPDLEPTFANQFEAGVEWYFSEASVFSVTAFNKDISGIVVEKVVPKEINGVLINQLRTPVNGGDSTIEGVEMQIQHVMDNGFGGYFNVTYSDVGDVNIGDNEFVPVPFASKDSYNLGVFYETDQYSARLNYNYRSDYFLASTEIGDRRRDEQSQLDAQFSYNVTDNITVKVEALNLTDEIWENYYVRGSDGARLGGSQSANGRRFFAGASFKF